MQYKVRVYAGTAFRSLLMQQIGEVYNSIDEIPTDIFETYRMRANIASISPVIWFRTENEEDAEVFRELVCSELGLSTNDKDLIYYDRDDSVISVQFDVWACKVTAKEDGQLWKDAKSERYVLVGDHYEPLKDVKKKVTQIKNTYLKKDPEDSDFCVLKN